MMRVLEVLFDGVIVASLLIACLAVWWAAWMIGWWAVAEMVAASASVAAALWLDGGDE